VKKNKRTWPPRGKPEHFSPFPAREEKKNLALRAKKGGNAASSDQGGEKTKQLRTPSQAGPRIYPCRRKKKVSEEGKKKNSRRQDRKKGFIPEPGKGKTGQAWTARTLGMGKKKGHRG